jgi:3-deoxy-D-manno-octulosonic-acid transferase
MQWLVNGCFLLAGLVIGPIVWFQSVTGRKRRGGWRERFGHVARRDGDRPCIWIHAVSMGETNATKTLIDQLAALRDDVDVVISTTTDTGYARAKQLYPDRLVFRYPLDLTWMVKRSLNRIRPSAIALMELEVWPNMMGIAHRRGIPVMVLNGRVTEDRSMRRFRAPVIRWFANYMFSRLAWVGAQDETYGGRFRELGVPPDRVEVTGSMKWDAANVSEPINGAEMMATAMGIDRRRPIWVCGSTGEGEEPLLLDAYKAIKEKVDDLQLAIVPRKPERFDEVAAMIERAGYLCGRRSRSDRPQVAQTGDNVTAFLGDTMGELRKFYQLANVVFVGRTLNGWGGSDPMEPAALAKPIVMGPANGNFADAVQRFQAANAIRVVQQADALPEAIVDLLGPNGADMAQRAKHTVLENQGATRRTAERILSFLPKRPTATD